MRIAGPSIYLYIQYMLYITSILQPKNPNSTGTPSTGVLEYCGTSGKRQLHSILKTAKYLDFLISLWSTYEHHVVWEELQEGDPSPNHSRDIIWRQQVEALHNFSVESRFHL